MTKRGVRCKADNKSNRSRARSTLAVTAMGVLTIGAAVAELSGAGVNSCSRTLGLDPEIRHTLRSDGHRAQQIRIYERSAHRL